MAGPVTALARWVAKAADLLPVRPFNQPLVDWGVWREPFRPRTDAASLITDGYAGNSAVFACIQTLARAFVEPELKVYDPKGAEQPDHPLKQLLRSPNALMSEGELWAFALTYAAVGGNAFLYKLRATPTGPPLELWPYHAAEMRAVPDSTAWVGYYAYALGNEEFLRLEPSEVVHWKWAIDPRHPWQGFPPLLAVVREVASDSELTRYLQALLANDAVPRGILKVPPGAPMNAEEQQRIRSDWNLRTGGARRGGLAILLNGASYERVGLNLQELAFDALRGVPEARIAAVLGVPAIVAGLNIGLARSTYSNFEEARKAFTESTLVPLWAALADEIQADLLPEFESRPGYTVAFDLSSVVALREGADKRYQRMVQAYQAGIINQNEARQELGYDALPDGDRFAPAPVLTPVTAPGKASKSRPATTAVEARLAAALEHSLVHTYRAVAAHLEDTHG